MAEVPCSSAGRRAGTDGAGQPRDAIDQLGIGPGLRHRNAVAQKPQRKLFGPVGCQPLKVLCEGPETLKLVPGHLS